MPKDKAIRIRCNEEQLADWHAYASSRGMELTDWARAALDFCRKAESDKKLDLRQTPPTVNFGSEEETIGLLVGLIEHERQRKKLTPPDGDS